jgi:hypothetical protein
MRPVQGSYQINKSEEPKGLGARGGYGSRSRALA